MLVTRYTRQAGIFTEDGRMEVEWDIDLSKETPEAVERAAPLVKRLGERIHGLVVDSWYRESSPFVTDAVMEFYQDLKEQR